MRRIGRAGLLLAAGLVVLASAGSARPDVEESERRLKSAGVNEALRERIHAAIAKGAKYLIARQQQDGTIQDPNDWVAKSIAESGYTALAGLALSHCGTKEATDAARRCAAYLVRDGKRLRGSAMSFTYTAGLSAMLLDVLHEHPDVCGDIVDTLAGGIDPQTGWWGYGPARSDFGAGSDLPNLSTAQFAALGLWAGGRASGRGARAAWRKHLESLCKNQAEDGSWTYGVQGLTSRPRMGYPTGTFMGLANLALARAGLGGELDDDPALAAASELALAHGRTALDRDGAALVSLLPESRGRFDFYGLYALEKACVFCDAQTTGNVDWYVQGATHLVGTQNGNGSWGTALPIQGIGLMPARPAGDVTSTAFSLLFLLRVSETFHPVTPRDLDASGPTTPGGGPAAPAEPRRPAAPPPPRPVTLTQAREALSRVDGWVRAKGADPKNALAALPDVAAALVNLVPDPLPPGLSPGAQMDRERAFLASSKAWRDEAGAVLVAAVGDDESEQVSLLAAKALAHGPRSASTPLRSAMERRIRIDHPEDAPRELVDAAFAALADIGNDDALPWLATRITDGREMANVRSARAALFALAQFDGGERQDRLAAARRIVRGLLDLSKRATAVPPAKQDVVETRTIAVHWRTLGPAALDALRALCTDLETGEPPQNPDGTPFASVQQYASWLEAARSAR